MKEHALTLSQYWVWKQKELKETIERKKKPYLRGERKYTRTAFQLLELKLCFINSLIFHCIAVAPETPLWRNDGVAVPHRCLYNLYLTETAGFHSPDNYWCIETDFGQTDSMSTLCAAIGQWHAVHVLRHIGPSSKMLYYKSWELIQRLYSAIAGSPINSLKLKLG